MEASGTPASGGAATPPPPPPTTAGTDDGKPGAGWRILAVVLALALAFACAVMVAVAVDIGGTPVEEDCVTPSMGGDCLEYFDGSSAQKTIYIVLAWPSAVLAGIAALLGLYFAATGKRGRLLLQLTGAAVALGALAILIGSV